jgi:hypothetical protein
MHRSRLLCTLLGLAVTLGGCGERHAVGPDAATGDGDPRAKIRFDVDAVDADGLIGPPDGRRSLSYELCIPADPAYRREVAAIDPGIAFQRGGRGRIGCTKNEILCIGDTHRPGWRESLEALTRLPYVERIEQTMFE